MTYAMIIWLFGGTFVSFVVPNYPHRLAKDICAEMEWAIRNTQLITIVVNGELEIIKTGKCLEINRSQEA